MRRGKNIVIVLLALFSGVQLIGFLGLSVWTALDPRLSYATATDYILAKSLPLFFVSHNRRAMWHPQVEDQQVWGYIDRHSIVPGEGFNIMLSTGPALKATSGNVEIFRVGCYGDEDRELRWRSDTLAITAQPVPSSSPATGPNWPVSVALVPTADWTSGYYAVDFVPHEGKRERDVAFIVVTNPLFTGDILVKLSTNTYQAYNQWGGHSFYRGDFTDRRGDMISFDRPTPPDFYQWEYYFVIWAERLANELGLTIDYATDFDVHRDQRFTEHYQIFISVGHDEYWSKEEFEHIYDRIFRLGKNTIFFGGNTAFWQVRYADVNNAINLPMRGRQLICYKSMDDPIRFAVNGDPRPLLTAKFRDVGRPQTMLMGVGSTSWFPSTPTLKYPYFVETLSLPFFEGSGYQKGDFVADIVGYEWDNTDPEGDGKRLWAAETSTIPEIPRAAIQVVFSGEPINFRGQKGKAEAVYFVSEAGAKVFSAGTIRWPWGLGKPGFEQEKFKRFNRNLLTYLME